jgi:hypothetical protein
MTSVPVVNQRATVEAVFVGDDEDRDYRAGEWNFYGTQDTDRHGILFGCPCGCGELKSVAFKASRPERPCWTWDNNEVKPTLTPSILIYQMNDQGVKAGEHWHGYLTNGVFKSC